MDYPGPPWPDWATQPPHNPVESQDLTPPPPYHTAFTAQEYGNNPTTHGQEYHYPMQWTHVESASPDETGSFKLGVRDRIRAIVQDLGIDPANLKYMNAKQVDQIIGNIFERESMLGIYPTVGNLILYFETGFGVSRKILHAIVATHRGKANPAGRRHHGDPAPTFIHDLRYAQTMKLRSSTKEKMSEQLHAFNIDKSMLQNTESAEDCEEMILPLLLTYDGVLVSGKIRPLYRYLRQECGKNNTFLQQMDAFRTRCFDLSENEWKEFYASSRPEGRNSGQENEVGQPSHVDLPPDSAQDLHSDDHARDQMLQQPVVQLTYPPLQQQQLVLDPAMMYYMLHEGQSGAAEGVGRAHAHSYSHFGVPHPSQVMPSLASQWDPSVYNYDQSRGTYDVAPQVNPAIIPSYSTDLSIPTPWQLPPQQTAKQAEIRRRLAKENSEGEGGSSRRMRLPADPSTLLPHPQPFSHHYGDEGRDVRADYLRTWEPTAESAGFGQPQASDFDLLPSGHPQYTYDTQQYSTGEQYSGGYLPYDPWKPG